MTFIVQPSRFLSVLCIFVFFHVPCLGQRKTSNDRIPGQVEFSCPEEFGYYPHPSDCTQYYVCVFGGAVLESCTGGLMYSHELQTCDWPRNVGCEGVDSVFADEQAIKQQSPQRSKAPPPPQQSPSPRPPPKQRDELLTKPLYVEEELGPAQEIESDRQQRVYRGQPATLGQVARDRDGIAKHANALQTSPGVKQHSPFQYSDRKLTSSINDNSDTTVDVTPIRFDKTLYILHENITDQPVTITRNRKRSRRHTESSTNSTYSSLDKNLSIKQRTTRGILIQSPKSRQKPPDNLLSGSNYQLRYVPSSLASDMNHAPRKQPFANEQYVHNIHSVPQSSQNQHFTDMYGHSGIRNVHGRSVQGHNYNNWGQSVLPIHNLFPGVSTKYLSTPHPIGSFMMPGNYDANVMRGMSYQYSPSIPYQYVPGARNISSAILESSRKNWLNHTNQPYNNYAPPSETVQLLYPPGSKFHPIKEEDEAKDETVIKDEIRDKKSTKRNENSENKYNDKKLLDSERKRDISEEDEEYEEDEEEGDDEEETENEGETISDDDGEDEDYEEEVDDDSDDYSKNKTLKNKFKEKFVEKPFHYDHIPIPKIKTIDPFKFSHGSRTGKTVNFGKTYSPLSDLDFIPTEKSSFFETSPKSFTTRITPLTSTKKYQKYQTDNFSGVNKPKQIYKSTYVPKSKSGIRNNYKVEIEKEKTSSGERKKPFQSDYHHYTSPFSSYHQPSLHSNDFKKPKNSSYFNKYDQPRDITKDHKHLKESHDLSSQNNRPSNHLYEDSYGDTTPYYSTEVKNPENEVRNIPNSMEIPHAYELTTTENPIAIKIHLHHHDEKVYEDDNVPSSTPQVFYHDYANDYDNYTEYADYSDYTGEPNDYDNITKVILSSAEVENEKNKGDTDENEFKGQDFYNDYYETPSTTTKRQIHLYDSHTSTTKKEKLYASLSSTAKPIQLDSYQNIIKNLKNFQPPRNDSIYFNAPSSVSNLTEYEVQRRLKKVTHPTTPTTPKMKFYENHKPAKELDYETYPQSSSIQKIVHTDPPQDNSLITNKVRKKHKLETLTKPRIKMRTKPPHMIRNTKQSNYSPTHIKIKPIPTTDRDLESKLNQTAVTQHNKMNAFTKTNVASSQNSQQAYLQQPTSSPSYNFSSAINQFSQQLQPKPQQRPQQNFDTSYYNLYDDDDFYREDDYAQQFQNQNRAKLQEQEDRQASQRDQQQQNQQQQRQQQNNLYNPASQDYKEQYFLQNADNDNRFEQPSKAAVLNATSTYSADSIKSNNSSPPHLSYSFEQTPQPAAQRYNQFTIPESQHILKPFPFNYEKPTSNDGYVLRNFESSLQRENTLPVVQLFEQDKPLRQQIENRKQIQSNEPVRQQVGNNERKYLTRLDNVNRNIFENKAPKANFRNEQRDPKRIEQVRGANDGFMSDFKESLKNENFRIVVDETSSTFKPTQSNNVRFNPTTPTQPRLFTSRDDALNQPSKIDYVTKVPQLSWEYSKNINETIKQRLNSALIGTALRDPLDSEKESSTSRFNTVEFKQGAVADNNAEWRNRMPNQFYTNNSTRSRTSLKNPFEISTEGIVTRSEKSNLEDNYRQSLGSTNVYTRPTTPSNSLRSEDKQNAPIKTFITDDSNNRQFPNQFNKATIQVPKQKQVVKPWKFNVDSKQISSEDTDKFNIKFSTLSQEKSTAPNTVRSNVTPYTPYNYIKQLTTINNNDIRGSTYRQQTRQTTPVPTSSRDFKEQQTKAHQVKVTADRAHVQEENSQRNGWSRMPEVTRYVEPTTVRFSTESNRFKLSKPIEGIKNNFVDSVSYSNATDDDSDEYYYDDDLEEYEDKLPDVTNPPSLPTLPPLKPATTSATTVRSKPEPVRTLAPSRSEGEKCIGSECNEKPLVRVRPTTSANQTTPILSSSRGRVRGSATYTTASPAELDRGEKPSSGGSRSRPTLKPSQSIVSKAATEFVDIYKYPPTRPESVYPTPTPDKTAAKCRKDVCLLPDCYCGGKDIPADLPVEETPQIVLLTFDDSVNDLNKGLYADLFEKGRTNPNGCPISATFYVSHEWTDYSQVQNLYANGHEMASHTVSHSFGEQFSQKKWTREIAGQREILAAYGGVRLEDVRGMRAPFLAVGGNKMFKMLYDSNFTYDSSMPVYENRPPSWPYTLDYKIFHDCMIPPCPTRSYPGVWEVPMVMWQDLNGGRCSMGDACSNPPDADGVYKMLIKNFERHFTTNRAPFGLYYHAAWFTQPHHKEGFINFLDTIVAMPETWVVTNWQALQWVRDPTPINRLNSFQPFSCDYPERPKKCNNPKVCNLWHKSGVRYMRTCQPCPEIYPWTGLSGIKNSRVDNEIINE